VSIIEMRTKAEANLALKRAFLITICVHYFILDIQY